MAEHILMTALSPTMEEGVIASWSKKEGDAVDSGDALCEVETDKATMEYEATQEGTLLKILVEAGGSAKVGEPIAVIGEEGEDISDLVEQAKRAATEGAKDTQEPEKSQEQSQPNEGAAPSKDSGEGREAGKAKTAQESAAPETEQPAQAQPAPSYSDGARIKASPLARKLAASRNINLAMVRGTGPNGRITKSDIENFRGVPLSAVTGAGRGVSEATPGGLAEDQVIPVAGKRAVIARRLSESKFSAPHYYLKTSVDMKGILDARKTLNQALPEKVSLNAFFVKFVAEALKRHPGVNASWQGDKIIQYASIDVGLAVDAGGGLITPVVRNCGNRGIVDIDGDLKVLIDKAKNGKLKPEEYTGATFTISNLGSFGVEEFTAIINPPGSAILAIGKTKKTPVVDDESGEIKTADIMKITLSCDHRVIDGAAGGRFLFDLEQMMENPVRLIF